MVFCLKLAKATGWEDVVAAVHGSARKVCKSPDHITESSDTSCSSDTQERIEAGSSNGSSSSPVASKAAPPTSFCKDRILTSLTPTASDLPLDRGLRLPGSSKQETHVRIRYAAYNQGGSSPGGISKDNQDAWFVREFPGDAEAALFGVFDGHGPYGQKVSQTLTNLLPEKLVSSDSWQDGMFAEALKEQIPACSAVICNPSSGIDCSLSGSTGVLALLEANRWLTVANVGDSRCFIGGVDERGECYSVPLSTDHTPMLPSEAKRIYACKGRIGNYSCEGKPVGPKRIFLPGQTTPGLSMTRAFGDTVASGIGLIAEPDMVRYQATDRYLVLCSDGLFEFMSNADITSSVHMLARRGHGPSNIAHFLVTEARRQWAEEEGDVIDDCTVIVALLDSAPAVRTINLTVGAGINIAAAHLDTLKREMPRPPTAAARYGGRMGHTATRGTHNAARLNQQRVSRALDSLATF